MSRIIPYVPGGRVQYFVLSTFRIFTHTIFHQFFPSFLMIKTLGALDRRTDTMARLHKTDS